MTISKSDSMIQVSSNLKPPFCKPDQLCNYIGISFFDIKIL